MAKKRVSDNCFSYKIALIAKEKFGSQKKMAEVLGLGTSTISDWVKGKSMPSLTVLKELCIKAEISLDWLVLGKTFEEGTLESEVIDKALLNELIDLGYHVVKEYIKNNPNLTKKDITSKNKRKS